MIQITLNSVKDKTVEMANRRVAPKGSEGERENGRAEAQGYLRR